jgi:hypothetical protein
MWDAHDERDRRQVRSISPTDARAIPPESKLQELKRFRVVLTQSV